MFIVVCILLSSNELETEGTMINRILGYGAVFSCSEYSKIENMGKLILAILGERKCSLNSLYKRQV